MRRDEFKDTETGGSIFIDEFLVTVHSASDGDFVFSCDIGFSTNQLDDPSVNQFFCSNVHTVHQNSLRLHTE